MENLLAKCNNDLMNCTWAHAVNSKSVLLEALKSDVHCIESDITFNYEDGLAYMSHPPVYKSDFQFHEYWKLCKSSDKIFKLDFKMIEAVELCLRFIDKKDMGKVIINADILETSNSKSKPVDPENFISLCCKYSSGAMISIGWTTSRKNEIGYKWIEVYKMRIILEKLNINNSFQMITLPIDVHMLSLNSIPKLLWLLDQFPNQNISLTIWSYKDVPIDMDCLILIRKLLKKSAIFVDIPQLKVSEKNILLSTHANSIRSDLKLNLKVNGRIFYQSCNPYVIGEETNVELRKKLDDKYEFFIVLISSDIENINNGPPSECQIFFRLLSLSESCQTISLRKNKIKYYDSNNELIQELLHKSSEEIVYFCSISCCESIFKFNVGTVEDYNTSSLICHMKSNLSFEIEPEIRFSVKTNSSDCKFIVIDFLNEFSSQRVKKM